MHHLNIKVTATYDTAGFIARTSSMKGGVRSQELGVPPPLCEYHEGRIKKTAATCTFAQRVYIHVYAIQQKSVNMLNTGKQNECSGLSKLKLH